MDLQPAYVCKACGAGVMVRHPLPNIWGCAHSGGTIIAQMDAVVSQSGGVTSVDLKRTRVGSLE
jgi:ribosomal protein L37AE/L43A